VPLRISFVQERLHLALPTGDPFQAPFREGSLNEDALLAYVCELLSLAGIVEELDLNTRIWSKGPSARAPGARVGRDPVGFRSAPPAHRSYSSFGYQSVPPPSGVESRMVHQACAQRDIGKRRSAVMGVLPTASMPSIFSRILR
jgi:hypothetical protein